MNMMKKNIGTYGSTLKESKSASIIGRSYQINPNR